jgi:hypothetical protein
MRAAQHKADGTSPHCRQEGKSDQDNERQRDQGRERIERRTPRASATHHIMVARVWFVDFGEVVLIAVSQGMCHAARTEREAPSLNRACASSCALQQLLL